MAEVRIADKAEGVFGGLCRNSTIEFILKEGGVIAAGLAEEAEQFELRACRKDEGRSSLVHQDGRKDKISTRQEEEIGSGKHIYA